jgi:thiosulfate reductase cytochrome b subunit
MKRLVLIYRRFERFWHWAQALLILLLAVTGFDVHFEWGLFRFDQAFMLHKIFAWCFVGLIAFAIFWHATTGEWRQYKPGGPLLAMVRYYFSGIFRNEPHPVKKTRLSKLNPLQKVAYLALKILVIPLTVTSGFLYYYYNRWDAIGLGSWGLGPIATIHTLAAFALVGFMISHIYLTTTGHTVLSNVKAMVTGYEELEEQDQQVV